MPLTKEEKMNDNSKTHNYLMKVTWVSIIIDSHIRFPMLIKKLISIVIIIP